MEKITYNTNQSRTTQGILYFITAYILLAQFLCYAEQFCAAKEIECTADGYDPGLKAMVYDMGSGNETVLTYISPDISSFYREPPGSRVAVRPAYVRFAAKFINLSPYMLDLFWDPGDGSPGLLHKNLPPFSAGGSATSPAHKFYVTYHDQPQRILRRFVMTTESCLYTFDPLNPKSEEHTRYNGIGLAELTDEERRLYEIQRLNLVFAEQYKRFTGRDWLSRYPRPPPRHKMWRADYFGQQHWVETRETHFVTLPPESQLTPNQQGSQGHFSRDQLRLLQQYRTPQNTLNLTLTAISCAPRAFEILNFLSDIEVHHIMYLATVMDLQRSTTGMSGSDGTKVKVRTSTNTWVDREKSPIVNAIYRRAADLLRIDESLLRRRSADEFPSWPCKKSAAESLQLVHYEVGQEYTAHHDFKHPPVSEENQSTRFATLLLYLNEGMKGGETSFPRWVNAETSDQLKIVPKIGKAVLFYSYLPDGNLDDVSQHAALPVLEGEKWLTNLWVWDPCFAHA